MFKARMVTLFVLGGLSLCFFYIWGCSFGSSSGGTIANPFGPGSVETIGSLPSRTVEERATKAVLQNFATALTERNAARAAEMFSPEVRSSYRAVFEAQIDKLSCISDSLKNSTMTFLSFENIPPEAANTPLFQRRMAEIKVTLDGATFYVRMVKVDGQWLLQSL